MIPEDLEDVEHALSAEIERLRNALTLLCSRLHPSAVVYHEDTMKGVGEILSGKGSES